jgi:peptidoglycan/LPS O-acetylase OafA/YrhL
LTAALAECHHVSAPSNRGGAMTAAPAITKPLDSKGHMPALDGVRGLAVLMVLLVHFVGGMLPTNSLERAIGYVTGYGAYGVDLFFVLSGFLITGILYDARDTNAYFRNFYMRRLLRIFPLYYGVLALLFFVAPLIPLLQGATLDNLVTRQAWAWLYGVNLYTTIRGEWALSYINHFWSLAIEEHFYLVWPLIVYLLARRPRTLIAVSLAVSLCAMLARLIASLIGLTWFTTGVLTPFRLDGLALGAFLAVAARQPGGMDRLIGALPWATAVVGGLLMATVTFWIRFLLGGHGLELAASARPMLIEMLLACLLMWALVAPEHSATSRFFRSRAMVFLGTYSYGLYVYHHFIAYYLMSNRTEFELAPWLGSHLAAVALQAALGMSASLAVAYLSYELFEKRFLRLKRLFGTARERLSERPAGPGATAASLLGN